MIEHACPCCGLVHELEDYMVGNKLRCQNCQKIAIVRDYQRSAPASGSDGSTALTFGILALLLCAAFGIPAIVFGNRVLKENPADGKARAGVILGWIAIIIWIVMFAVFYLLLMLFLSRV